ncbi:hypothetical protein A3D88_03005 [Candidatus Peribacteria bacterium RIFCSPHIGHO2_02_FULL_52_16]|nr:MAG: hypothetical protein A2706_06070 [Candidatus Peribacteria bacterium RIFCSPHIGHO2_01_FULL_51_35]OGJ60649.1 MAG: hypothetical protein A3D88_03005 [Candidatus Peribacteria bacterium RIFCSPHIGHO2_02_FULL_52_16]
MPVPSFITTCKKNERIANDIYEIVFEKPEGFTFKAGQYILFDVPLMENANDIQTRAFSIASSPKEDDLLFAMKLKPGGRASRWIVEQLKPGMSARMQGPFGRFVLDPASDKELLMIGTSTGVAPYRSQLPMILPTIKQRIDLIFGARSEDDLFWKEPLENLAKQSENFFLHIALSKPSGTWKGHTGRVQTLVPLIVKDFSNKSVYICGSPDMTTELKKTALEQWGVEKQNLHVEGYI